MNTIFRATLLAAALVLPTAAFAQSVVQVDETQVEVVAHDVLVPDAASVNAGATSAAQAAYATAQHNGEFNPATSAGLNSIYTRH